MSVQFSLGTFSVAGCTPFAGIVVGEQVIAVTALKPLCEQLGLSLNLPETVLGLLQSWEHNFKILQFAVNELEQTNALQLETAPLKTLKIHAPVLYPRQIFCAGANYRKHVIELATAQGGGVSTEGMSREERRQHAIKVMDERIAHGTPYVFTKLPSAVTGPFDPISLPTYTEQADWELELGVIIGKIGRNVSRENALELVAGYTIVNDLTNRDKVYRPDLKALGTDWLLAKSSRTFCPTGPYLLPASFITNPQQLQITLRLNGMIMQDESTSDMIFSVARLIEYISAHVELWPGDLICTGSPAGNGTHYNRYLQPGDVLEGTISGLGSLHNTCNAPETRGH